MNIFTRLARKFQAMGHEHRAQCALASDRFHEADAPTLYAIGVCRGCVWMRGEEARALKREAGERTHLWMNRWAC